MSRTKAPGTVLVTGASSGLGAAIALEYANSDVTLLLIGRDTDRLTAIASSCCARGARCEVEALDVRDTSRLLEVIERWDETFSIDLAVLNAGVVAGRQEGEGGERPQEILIQVDTNLRATLIAANCLISRMCKRRRGYLAVVSSLNALYPVPDAPTYSATKAALSAYVQGTRSWASQYGVQLAIILPGFIRTGFSARYEGPRPLELSAQNAARRIRRALQRGRETIVFPMALRALIALSRLVPRRFHRLVVRAYGARLEPLVDHSDFSKIR